MSYSVLARKWRPKNFAELVGQQHVMQALANALDQQRLHHAYLFTGTRGVGKTTIARIFAKALNCETGVTSKPCGQCQACRSIDEGRFIDLIEVDAASKTKVDDTREILENVQFAPTQGRYKVYLIDEVHMLSKSSFNALLKTLEEPPEHVKFLLATTDPHKLLNTVLSRCLQFNLMRLTQIQIQNHLQNILQQEQIPFEESALALIAKSADGSARDALSLLDQAIAYGAGKIEFVPVQTMLGLVDQQYVLRILQALAEDSPQLIKEVMQDLSLMGVDYDALLASLSETLHEISYFQMFGESVNLDSLPVDIVQALAQALSAERVQTLYQISLLTKQDMQLAPDNRIGFEMGLMRMLAFDPSRTVASVESQEVDNVSVTEVNAAMKPSQALAALRDGLNSIQDNHPPEQAVSTAINQSSSAVVQQQTTTPQPEISTNMSATNAIAPNVAQQDFGLASGEVAPEQSMLDSMDPQAAIAQMGSARNLVGKEVTPRKPSYPQESDTAATEPQQSIAEPKAGSLMDQMLAGFDNLGKLDAPEKAEETSVSQPKPTKDLDSSLRAQLAKMGGEQVTTGHSQTIQQPEPQIINPSERVVNEAPTLNNQTRVDAPPALDDVPPWLMDEPAQPSQNEYAHSFNDSIESVPAPETNIEHLAPVEQSYSDPAVDQPVQQAMLQQSEKAEQRTSVEWQMPTSVQLSEDAMVKMKQWRELIQQLELKAMVLEIARQAVLIDYNRQALIIAVDPEQNFSHQQNALQLFTEQVQNRLGVVLEFASAQQFDRSQLTPQQQDQVLAQERQQQAEVSIATDPIVQNFMSTLNMQVLPNSTKPLMS
ncbi:DNA polymerase III subunit gamma/tau [Thiomicrorhabdus sp. 6S2-11]|uniref:DNA-directed DNA polymerase n=1 Tax=Thiomicrorhabdus marina TaxID=2818442 RepID=A0ABS3Q6U2_9GAMM|nr:DNA polymerase III subunit gamma/tau [Thiomicrorhabdus marina]MBO1927669.1 DNA polymerase III subunit gamma/tau [Thiomicrorhabdus marina]